MRLVQKFKQWCLANNVPAFPVLWTGLVLIFLFIIIFYWIYADFFPSTNDSYIGGDIINYAAEVTAPVVKVNFQDHQHVRSGQIIAQLDSRAFQIAVAESRANLLSAEQAVSEEQTSVQAAQARVEDALANLRVQQDNVPRYLQLVEEGKLPRAEGAKAKGALDSAIAQVKAAQDTLLEAQQKLGRSVASNPQIMLAQAQLANAELQLSHTVLIAPADGTLINFSLRPGTMVSAQQTLFSIVEDHAWWADANFKETQLKRIRIGQSATVSVDMYPGVSFSAKVAGISIGSGSAFSILPAENASGNWVKVTQRFTVRVRILKQDPRYPLRVGASCTVTVNTL